MIPYNRLLLEMERQLSTAKQAGDEQAMREALSALRSLCEVALSGHERKESPVFPKMLSTDRSTTPVSLEGKVLEEEDANGGSLFDF